MKEPFHALKISDSVYWVGAIDWNLRDFHGYATERGTTYNAFLILADKVTLIDTVKAPFVDEMMARVASVVSPERIDYIVSNHAEMDHTGGLPAVMQATNPERVFASTKGVQALESHFHMPDAFTAVGNGETISLGNANVTFYETRMLHWPDSMFTFLDTDGILFTQDAFGMHWATPQRFADELDATTLEYEGSKYFANILTPYAALVGKQLEKTLALNLPIKLLAPDHGPVYRDNLTWILERYTHWAAQEPTNKTVIAYDTMWESTAKMARATAQGVIDAGGSVELFNMNKDHRSNVATALLGAGGFIVGSPTMNNNLFPTIADLLTYVKGLRFKNLAGAAFGSYGWGGEAVKQVNESLKTMKVDLVSEGMRVQYVPTHDDLEHCRMLGEQVGQRLNTICSGKEN